MKTTGFINSFNSESFSKLFEAYHSEDEIRPEREIIIDYLSKGKLCVPLMGAVDDPLDEDDESFVGYMAIYTDGTYIWPHYFLAFLKKYPYLCLDDEFVEHVLNNQFEEISVDPKIIQEFEQVYYSLGEWEDE